MTVKAQRLIGGFYRISRKQSPIRSPLLVVTNEVSGTTTIYKVSKQWH